MLLKSFTIHYKEWRAIQKNIWLNLFIHDYPISCAILQLNEIQFSMIKNVDDDKWYWYKIDAKQKQPIALETSSHIDNTFLNLFHSIEKQTNKNIR